MTLPFFQLGSGNQRVHPSKPPKKRHPRKKTKSDRPVWTTHSAASPKRLAMRRGAFRAAARSSGDSQLSAARSRRSASAARPWRCRRRPRVSSRVASKLQGCTGLGGVSAPFTQETHLFFQKATYVKDVVRGLRLF